MTFIISQTVGFSLGILSKLKSLVFSIFLFYLVSRAACCKAQLGFMCGVETFKAVML